MKEGWGRPSERRPIPVPVGAAHHARAFVCAHACTNAQVDLADPFPLRPRSESGPEGRDLFRPAGVVKRALREVVESEYLFGRVTGGLDLQAEYPHLGAILQRPGLNGAQRCAAIEPEPPSPASSVRVGNGVEDETLATGVPHRSGPSVAGRTPVGWGALGMLGHHGIDKSLQPVHCLFPCGSAHDHLDPPKARRFSGGSLRKRVVKSSRDQSLTRLAAASDVALQLLRAAALWWPQGNRRNRSLRPLSVKGTPVDFSPVKRCDAVQTSRNQIRRDAGGAAVSCGVAASKRHTARQQESRRWTAKVPQPRHGCTANAALYHIRESGSPGRRPRMGVSAAPP
jgi:hypothetical protein